MGWPGSWADSILLETAVIGSGFALLALIEYASFPISMPSVPVGKDFPQVYTWLAQQPGDFAILEMPLPTRSGRNFRGRPLRLFFRLSLEKTGQRVQRVHTAGVYPALSGGVKGFSL